MLHYGWWILAVALGIAELVTGTFFLLVLAVATAAGGLAAWLGHGIAAQLATAAVVAVVGWAGLRRLRGRRREPGPDANPDLLLDVGQRIRIDRWQEPTRTSVVYRGTRWAVELDPEAGAAPAEPGEYRIRRIAGNALIVGPG